MAASVLLGSQKSLCNTGQSTALFLLEEEVQVTDAPRGHKRLAAECFQCRIDSSLLLLGPWCLTALQQVGCLCGPRLAQQQRSHCRQGEPTSP